MGPNVLMELHVPHHHVLLDEPSPANRALESGLPCMRAKVPVHIRLFHECTRAFAAFVWADIGVNHGVLAHVRPVVGEVRALLASKGLAEATDGQRVVNEPL